jgi:hypothetical protein
VNVGGRQIINTGRGTAVRRDAAGITQAQRSRSVTQSTDSGILGSQSRSSTTTYCCRAPVLCPGRWQSLLQIIPQLLTATSSFIDSICYFVTIW